MYLVNFIRPDIAYTVGRLSRYTKSSNKNYYISIHRVVKYLRGTIYYGLCYIVFPSVLEEFSDANWIFDLNKMKSISGYVFTLGGGVVSWKSTMQTCFTRFAMEVEFIALEKTSFEAEWFRNLLVDIPLWMRLTLSVLCIVIAKLQLLRLRVKYLMGRIHIYA